MSAFNWICPFDGDDLADCETPVVVINDGQMKSISALPEGKTLRDACVDYASDYDHDGEVDATVDCSAREYSCIEAFWDDDDETNRQKFYFDGVSNWVKWI